MSFFSNTEDEHVPIQTVIDNVKKMTTNSKCKEMASKHKLSITNVQYEDCARDKFSVWGPCISDMTLQVNNERMPVIREPNYTDTTWDVELDKIPLVIGNEDNNPGAELKTISLRQYLENFSDYMSVPSTNKINLISNDIFAQQTDKHVIMSSQCCFLPIEKGKETRFNVALFNYQSKKDDPAVLVIVSTSKGTSAQIIEGKTQKLLFNNNGMKSDFIGQRLTDNRIERNVPIHGPMTKQEKQDNCIVIIQIPLKQKPKEIHVHHTQYNYVPVQPQPNPFNTYQSNAWNFGGSYGSSTTTTTSITSYNTNNMNNMNNMNNSNNNNNSYNQKTSPFYLADNLSSPPQPHPQHQHQQLQQQQFSFNQPQSNNSHQNTSYTSSPKSAFQSIFNSNTNSNSNVKYIDSKKQPKTNMGRFREQ